LLSVDILSVTDIQDNDNQLVILNLVYHPEISLADTPTIPAFEFFGSWWPGILGKVQDGLFYFFVVFGRNFGQLL